MKPHWQSTARCRGYPRPGFALVVTLSLMILLTIIAVGLLTLSSISHRLALYRDGRIVSEGPADQFSAEQVMAALTSQSQPS